ncbi:MAG: putative ABC transporter permease [Spirochaetia bacterium]|nr:putative ABC transporter permease [Spirochaetia bacterium]
MNFLLVAAFLFFAGSLIGWTIELVWRRFFSKNNPERKWINPGFLVGPYLPLYGFSLVILFSLSFIDVSFIENFILQKAVLFVLMALCITVFEFFAGLIFIKGMKIKLWDYSNCWGNIKGIICPLYSFFWYVMSALYYFIIHPKILNWLFWFTNHLSFSFVVGFFYGIFLIDCCYSLNIMNKIRRYAKENKLAIHHAKFQQYISSLNRQGREKSHFWISTKIEGSTLAESLKSFIEKIKKQ